MDLRIKECCTQDKHRYKKKGGDIDIKNLESKLSLRLILFGGFNHEKK